MNQAFTLGVNAGKRLTYHTPGAVKPKVNGFDKVSPSYGKPKLVSERPKTWGGAYGGPSTNGLDDFLSDTEREQRNEQAKLARADDRNIMREMGQPIERNAHVEQGPRLRRPNATAYRLLTGEKAHDPLLTRTVALPNIITLYAPLAGERSTKFYSVKVKA